MNHNSLHLTPVLLSNKSESFGTEGSRRSQSRTSSGTCSRMFTEDTHLSPMSLSGHSFSRPRTSTSSINLNQNMYDDSDEDDFFLATPQDIGLLPSTTHDRLSRPRDNEDFDIEIEAINGRSRRLQLRPRAGINLEHAPVPNSECFALPIRTRLVPEVVRTSTPPPPSLSTSSSTLLSRPADMLQEEDSPRPVIKHSKSEPNCILSSPALLSSPEFPTKKRRVTIDYTSPTPASKKQIVESIPSPCEPIHSCNDDAHFLLATPHPQPKVVRCLGFSNIEDDRPNYQTPTSDGDSPKGDYAWILEGPPPLKPVTRPFL